MDYDKRKKLKMDSTLRESRFKMRKGKSLGIKNEIRSDRDWDWFFPAQKRQGDTREREDRNPNNLGFFFDTNLV